MEVPRPQLKHAPAVHVALAHQAPQLGMRPLGVLTLARHHLQSEPLGVAEVKALEHHHQALVSVAHKPQPGLHTGDALVLSQRHGHVLDTAQLDRRRPRPPANELGQARAIPLHHRQPDDLHLAPRQPRVHRHLKVRAIPRLKRPADHRQPAGLHAEMLSEATPHRRLRIRRKPLGPIGEVLERLRELLRLHAPMLARALPPGSSARASSVPGAGPPNPLYPTSHTQGGLGSCPSFPLVPSAQTSAPTRDSSPQRPPRPHRATDDRAGRARDSALEALAPYACPQRPAPPREAHPPMRTVALDAVDVEAMIGAGAAGRCDQRPASRPAPRRVPGLRGTGRRACRPACASRGSVRKPGPQVKPWVLAC